MDVELCPPLNDTLSINQVLAGTCTIQPTAWKLFLMLSGNREIPLPDQEGCAVVIDYTDSVSSAACALLFTSHFPQIPPFSFLSFK